MQCYTLYMTKLTIITGEETEILRTPTKKVQKITKAHLKLFRDMHDTMKKIGVGIAGPQVGVGERLCLAQFNGKVNVMVNPDITWRSEEVDSMEEGCLSLPKVEVTVERPIEIIVSYLNEKGEQQERKLSGLDARIVQHEVDHLDGVLIVDY